MDNSITILFASVIATMTALNFIELRRIRKGLEKNGPATDAAKAKTG